MSKLPHNTDGPTFAVIYGAKSTQDRRRSIDTQHDDARAKCETETWTIAGQPFSDDGFSAFSGNRGPDLIKAIDYAAALADKHGRPVMLVTQAADRFARGAGDEPGAARSLVELWHECRRRGVHLRTVDDDDAMTDSASVAVAGRAAHVESKRRSKNTARGLERAARRGEWSGGQVPDGFQRIPPPDTGQPATLELHPQRHPVLRRCLDLGLQGLTCGEAARTLAGEGTLACGRDGFAPWTAGKVYDIWRNPRYAALAVYRGKILDGVRGKWPEIITPAEFWRLQAIMDARGAQRAPYGSSRRPGQRRTARHLLAGLGVCGICGGPIHAIAVTPRQDGTQPRRYICKNTRASNGACTAQRIDAEVVERPFVENLAALTLNLEGWRSAQRGELDARREAVLASVASAEDELARLRSRERAATDEYDAALDAGDADRIAAAAAAVARLPDRVRQAEHRLAELRDVLDATPEDADMDSLLDLYSILRDALVGRVVGDTVADVNARLREALDRIVMTPREDGSAVLRAYFSEAFLASLEGTQEAFAAVSELNGGPAVERDTGGLAAVLTGRTEPVQAARELREGSPSWR